MLRLWFCHGYNACHGKSQNFTSPHYAINIILEDLPYPPELSVSNIFFFFYLH